MAKLITGPPRSSIQARLYEVNILDEGEAVFDHERIYEEGAMAGIYDEEFAESLKQLWTENRSKNYYREGIPSLSRARKMYELQFNPRSYHRDEQQRTQMYM